MESRIRHVKTLLCKGADDVCFIGIWGMGGIGKTTIARVVYHQISFAFEGSSFLENVRENDSYKRGLESLQEKLLSEILQTHFNIKDCDDGMCQIRRRLRHKKVLVVLDDVDNIKQLLFLAGSCDWFGPGSRILVTARDEHLLCCAQEKYAPELLKETEALKLFSTYAFMKNTPPKEFEELSRVVVSHTGHLPLALKVLGSHFCGRKLDFWQSGLNVLAKIPHDEINGVLKISYDGLNFLEKKIFLYIACIFKGKERRHATRILDALGLEAVSGITVLMEKSLLSILDENLHMHDLIQEMGQCIARECYPNTFVWVPEEIKEVMTTISRLETIEAMIPTEPWVPVSAELLKSMKNLRLLEVKRQFTTNEPTYFPKQLRWLSWDEYPFHYLRIKEDMTELVRLIMNHGYMRKLQIGKKVVLSNLKFIDLQYSSSISIFPSVSGVPNLERLNLHYCNNLIEVHKSVFHHGKIVYLNLSDCHSLEILSSCINMKSLQTLILSSCYHLRRFPEVSKDMERLSFFDIQRSFRIRTLPSSIRFLTGLTTLSMGSCFDKPDKKIILENLLIEGSLNLSSLRVMELRFNSLDDNFPSNLHTAWPSLEEFILCGNMFTQVPATISQLSHLKYLDLSYCVHLKELPELPPRIQVLKINDCTSLEKIGDLSNACKWLFKISLCGCSKLLKDGESQSHIANMLMKSLVKKCAAVNHRLSITVPGRKIPNWFNNQQLGNKIQLHLPHNHVSKMTGLAICCRLPSMRTSSILEIKFEPSNKGNSIGSPTHLTSYYVYMGWINKPQHENVDGTWVGYMPVDILGNLCHGFEHENFIITLDYDHVEECGVCVLYQDDIKPMTGTGSWISDYDELSWNDEYSGTSEAFENERWSRPIFSFVYCKISDRHSVKVRI